MQELCPTRVRLVWTIYDFARQDYRNLSGASMRAVIANAGEGRRLLRLLLAVVEGKQWQDARNRERDEKPVVAENNDGGGVGSDFAPS